MKTAPTKTEGLKLMDKALCKLRESQIRGVVLLSDKLLQPVSNRAIVVHRSRLEIDTDMLLPLFDKEI